MLSIQSQSLHNSFGKVRLIALVSVCFLLSSCGDSSQTATPRILGGGAPAGTSPPTAIAANPQARIALRALRQQSSYPVFVPTRLPGELTPDPPIPSDQQIRAIRIHYRTINNQLALTVVNGPVDCCLDHDARHMGITVQIPQGLSGHFLEGDPQTGGPILWWQQAGAYIAVSGPQLKEADLIRIAGSVSETADL